MARQAHVLQVELLTTATELEVEPEAQNAVAQVAMVYYGDPTLHDRVLDILRAYATSYGTQIKLMYVLKRHLKEVKP